MKILIIEDEQLAADKLVSLLLKIKDDNEVLAVLESVDESIEWLESHEEPDIILSDIHLSDGLVFSLFSRYQPKCPVIFTTAYDKYALQAFEVNSIDYLLKPIEESKLIQAFQKYDQLKNSSQENLTELYQKFQTMLSSQNKKYKARFLCKLGNRIKSIPTEKVAYFYSQDKITFLVNLDNQRFPINNTLDEIDQMLNPDTFFRVNRKFITHFDAINEIHPYFKGRLKLKLSPHIEEDIVVSTEKSPIFKAWLDR